MRLLTAPKTMPETDSRLPRHLVSRNWRESGPFTPEQLTERVLNGDIPMDSWFCHQGTSEWKPLVTLFPDIAERFRRPSDQSLPSDRDPGRIRALLIGLLIACPFHMDNPQSCPLCEVRKKKLNERLRRVSSLSTEEMRRIIQNHKACLGKLEANSTS